MNTSKPFLIDTGKGFNLKYKNRLFYSSQAPEESVLKKIKQINVQEKTLIFVPCPGLGYGLKELTSRLPDNSHVLCVEADKTLWKFYSSESGIQLPAHEKLTILQTDNAGELIKITRELGIYRFRRADMAVLCGGFGLYPGIYTELFKDLETEIRNYWQNKLTLIHMAPLWIKNLFTNLNSMEEIHPLAALETTKPVLVAAAGPSLEDSLDWIKTIREEVLLICVDTAFPVLWQHGIKPDYILIVEAQLANLWDFMVCLNSRIPVICDLSSNAHVIRSLKTAVFLFCSRFYPVALFNRMQKAGILPLMIPPLGSVGIAALYIAVQITSGPVLFTGLDLSFTKNKTHSRGAPFSDHVLIHTCRLCTQETQIYNAIKKRPLLKVTGKDFKPLLTDLVLKSYADSASQLLAGNRQLYDIGTTGLDLGVRRLNHSEAAVLLAGQRGRKSSQPGSLYRNSDLIFAARQVSAFLKKEQHLLARAADSLQQVLEHKKELDTEQREQFLEQLRQLDYVYIHFPDPVKMPSPEDHILLRILIAVKHYLVILERLNLKEV